MESLLDLSASLHLRVVDPLLLPYPFFDESTTPSPLPWLDAVDHAIDAPLN